MVSSTKARRYLGLLLAVLLPGEPATVDAGVIINGTRHIYPERQAEITIQLTNEDGAAPRLVQAWVEPADRRTGPEDSHVPFSLSPPVFRIEAGKGHAMRLVYSREPLPEDRETLFWLNVLEVPPRFHPLPTLGDEQANQLRFAFRIRTKVFFRPDRLPGKPDGAPGQLRWSLYKTAEGRGLEVYNPSAFHVTFNEVALALGPRADARLLRSDTGMVAPGDTLRLAVHEAAMHIPADAQVHFQYINDYGAFSPPQRAALRF
ncbi:molecular chaperone [Pseudomonas allii]|uniref:Molecular chaperone n=2 Tax=Pseudomonas allii TaxID=2740531 RepID=A0ACC6LA96_9PSED|nr:molecular chaperone [Pseudomonas allii]KTB60691.1 phytochrome sensor protein [Pseudomonas fluorescens]MDR9875397.1 molecular chaperone [Pseudomonas allii]NWN47437.1 molecular chaperone [Pseudomonas allii]NWN61180.1 molecular chaperone [Pseudomonas allii]RMP89856.1 hypothetical protein ALQ17_04092 [Pseudomonas fluorescens]